MIGPRRPASPHRGARLVAALALVAACAPAVLPGPATAAAVPARRVLDLPLYAPESGLTAVPAYAAHKFVLELAPDGPRPAPAGLRSDAVAPRATGLAALDALDARFAVTALEPLFTGATPPAPGTHMPDLSRFYVVHLPDGAALAEALAAYAGAPGVVSAEPVGILPVSYVPNDPMAPNQFALGQPNGHDSNVYAAWDVWKGDTTSVIAILDTGVEYAHPDLGGASAPYTDGNIWTNWAEMAGTQGVDDDGDGEVDDYRG